MENNALKGSLFGGFNRQNVIDYIAKLSTDANAQLAEVQKELAAQADQRESLQRMCDAQQSQLAQCQAQLQTITEQNATLSRELERQRTLSHALSEELAPLKEQHSALEQEAVSLRRQASEYARMKSHVAEIELAARQRADALTKASHEQTAALLAECRTRYERAMQALTDACRQSTLLLRETESELSELPAVFENAQAALEDVSAHLLQQ